MREIKMRGKCIEEGEFFGKWVYGDLLHKNRKTYITPHANGVSVNGSIGKVIIMHEVDRESVGQYTGIKDRNGKEIYEGDIVEIKRPKVKGVQDQGTERGKILFDDKRGRFAWQEPGSGVLYCLTSNDEANEVIGNIYENPDLLEGGSQNDR